MSLKMQVAMGIAVVKRLNEAESQIISDRRTSSADWSEARHQVEK